MQQLFKNNQKTLSNNESRKTSSKESRGKQYELSFANKHNASGFGCASGFYSVVVTNNDRTSAAGEEFAKTRADD